MKILFLSAVVCLAAHVALAERARVLQLQTTDEVGVSAIYLPPFPTPTDAVPAVLFLHGLGESRDEWGNFPQLLQNNGIAVMAIDLRGHGDSTRQITASGPRLMDYRNFTTPDFQAMMLDVNAAVDWLEEQPVVDKKRIILIGSSLGANLAVRYAMEHEELAGLLLFSPAMTFRDVRVDDVFPKLRRLPLRVVVSMRDTYSYESSKQLVEQRRKSGHAKDFWELIVCSGGQHGAEQLKNVKELKATLVRWLRQVLFNEEPEPVAPPKTGLTTFAPVAVATNAPTAVTTGQPKRSYKKPNRPLP